jgi:hypothetical protein
MNRRQTFKLAIKKASEKYTKISDVKMHIKGFKSMQEILKDSHEVTNQSLYKLATK